MMESFAKQLFSHSAGPMVNHETAFVLSYSVRACSMQRTTRIVQYLRRNAHYLTRNVQCSACNVQACGGPDWLSASPLALC